MNSELIRAVLDCGSTIIVIPAMDVIRRGLC